MKRLLSLLLVISMLFCTLVGCASEDEGEAFVEDIGQNLADDLDSEDYSDTSSESHNDTQTQQNDQNLVFFEDVESGTTVGGESYTGNIVTGNIVTAGDSKPDTDTGSTGSVVTAPYEDEKLKLPKINITTYSGDITSKEEYVKGAVSVTNAGAQDMARTAIEIRGRGNSTWVRFDKKPYKIRFSVKTDMLGMGAAKKWILLANAFDDTMIRSALVFDLAKELGLEYTTEYRYVNVYINNKYEGVYILCEQVEEGQNRIDVNSSKTGELDTGYVLESYSDGARPGEQCFTLPKVGEEFLGSNPYHTHVMIIKSPDKKIVTSSQKKFIQDYIIKVNNAILGKDWQKINELVDIDSFVNMFIVEQMILSNDMGYTFYMYKRAGGKLYLGPVWDYDQSAGNSEHGGPTYKGWYSGSEHKWYTSLIQMPEFKALVAARYNEKKDVIRGVVNEVDRIASENRYDFDASNYVHNNFGNKKRWRTIPEICSLTTYDQHLAYLKTWLTNRLIWMEDQLSIK